MKSERYNPNIKQRLNLALIGIAVAIIAGCPRVSWAQGQLPSALSESTRVSMLTILPGDAVYSAFGHTAIRFEDRVFGYDIAFNYGTFDDTDPLFIPKFTYGRMDYLLSYGSTRGLIAAADYERRILIEQVLRLSRVEIAQLYELLRENARPENRVYRYDFVRQNCSTMVIDALRAVTGSRLVFDSTNVTPESFRELLRPYLRNRHLLSVGIDIVFGSRTDRDAGYYERSFLPLELMAMFDDAKLIFPVDSLNAAVESTSGMIPLVARKDTLLWFAERAKQSNTFPWVVALSWVLLFGWFGWERNRRKKRTKAVAIGDRILFGILGAAGVVIVFLWFVSAHTVTTANWNLVWALPSHLWPALFPSRMTKIHVRRYFFLTGGLAAALLVVQPLLSQSLHAAIVPVVIMIAWRSWVVIRSTASRGNQ